MLVSALLTVFSIALVPPRSTCLGRRVVTAAAGVTAATSVVRPPPGAAAGVPIFGSGSVADSPRGRQEDFEEAYERNPSPPAGPRAATGMQRHYHGCGPHLRRKWRARPRDVVHEGGAREAECASRAHSHCRCRQLDAVVHLRHQPTQLRESRHRPQAWQGTGQASAQPAIPPRDWDLRRLLCERCVLLGVRRSVRGPRRSTRDGALVARRSLLGETGRRQEQRAWRAVLWPHRRFCGAYLNRDDPVPNTDVPLSYCYMHDGRRRPAQDARPRQDGRRRAGLRLPEPQVSQLATGVVRAPLGDSPTAKAGSACRVTTICREGLSSEWRMRGGYCTLEQSGEHVESDRTTRSTALDFSETA